MRTTVMMTMTIAAVMMTMTMTMMMPMTTLVLGPMLGMAVIMAVALRYVGYLKLEGTSYSSEDCDRCNIKGIS